MEPEEQQIQENQTLLQRIKNNKKILIISSTVIILLIVVSIIVWALIPKGEETTQTQTAQRFTSKNQIPEGLIYFSTPVFDFDNFPNPNEDSVAVDLLLKMQRTGTAEVTTTLTYDTELLGEVEFAPADNVTVLANETNPQNGQISLSLEVNSEIPENEDFKLGSIIFSPATLGQQSTEISPIFDETIITSQDTELESGVAALEVFLPSDQTVNTQTIPEGAEEQLQQQNEVLQQNQQ